MITLRKHKHCETCGKPLPKDHIISVSDDWQAILDLVTTTCFDSIYSMSECESCFAKTTRNRVKAAVELIRHDTFLRGYDHRYSHGMIGRYCPLCERILDKDNICPQCNREYEP